MLSMIFAISIIVTRVRVQVDASRTNPGLPKDLRFPLTRINVDATNRSLRLDH